VKNIITELIRDVEKAQDKSCLLNIIDEIIALTERSDNVDVVDALCYIITVTEDQDVRSQALTVIDKVKGR
jgi:hypothetical protein